MQFFSIITDVPKYAKAQKVDRVSSKCYKVSGSDMCLRNLIIFLFFFGMEIFFFFCKFFISCQQNNTTIQRRERKKKKPNLIMPSLSNVYSNIITGFYTSAHAKALIFYLSLTEVCCPYAYH